MNRQRVGSFLAEVWRATVRDAPPYCHCRGCQELAGLRAELDHVRAEAKTAHESFCRACHSYWPTRAERDRLAAVVEMVHRLAHEALLDPSHLLAFAEAVVHATDTQVTPLTKPQNRTEGGTYE